MEAMSLLKPLLLAFCILSTIAERMRLSMDFNWRFHLGESDLVNCSTADFPINMTGVQCQGLNQAQANSIDECRNACCGDPNCGTYQWCPPSGKGCSPASSCWVGARNSCNGGTGWLSMGRPTPAPQQGPIDPSYNDSSWTLLNVPNDFIVDTGAFNPNNDKSHGYLPKNISWYRKHFSLDSSYKGQNIWIDFDGVYRNSDIWINGIYLGNHQSGYTSFRWYIGQYQSKLNFGQNSDNVIAMRVDPTHNEGWWYEGGGIYRHVWLNVANPVHIKPWGIYAGNNVTQVINNKYGNAMIDIQTNLTYNESSGSSMTVSLQTDIISKSTGEKLATNTKTGISMVAGKEVFVSQKFNVDNVLLWSIKNPELHFVYSTVIDSNNNIIDSVQTTFGFRKTYFDVNGGLYLNDEYVKMTGFCNHQDFAGCGTAMPNRVNRFRVQHLQELGANSWRMSHNPPNIELLDFTDDLGMLVWDENRNFANNTQYLQDQTDMINRDKNHPSIVIWSLCNEGGCMEGSANGASVGKMFEAIIRRIDNVNTRPISAAMNADWGDSLSTVLDIQGINYNYGQYDSYHKAHPTQPIISSESCSCTSDRGVYASNSSSGHVSAYTSCVWSCWQPVAQRKFVIGSMDWTGFDYKGEPTPYSWPDVNSHFGVNDLAGFPKDDYWYYRAWWQQDNETIIHIVPDDWNQWNTNQKINIWVYTNALYIDLQLNGQSVSNGMQSVSTQSALQLSVTYVKGKLTAIGYDKNKNNIGNHSIETTNQPYAIELESEYPGNTIYSDGQDVSMIEVQIVDNMGRRVPDASNMVDFSVTGDGVLYGVGNGDPACHEPDKGTSRSAFHGRVRVIVQSLLNKPGEMRLTATSNGLLSKTITIYTVPKQETIKYV